MTKPPNLQRARPRHRELGGDRAARPEPGVRVSPWHDALPSVTFPFTPPPRRLLPDPLGREPPASLPAWPAFPTREQKNKQTAGCTR